MVTEFSQVQAAVLEFRPGLGHGIAEEVGHHHLAGNDGIDGQEHAPAFFHRGSGLGLLPIYHAAGQSAHEHGIHHFHLHMAFLGHRLRLRNGQVGEIRCGYRFPVPGDEAESHRCERQQHRHEDGGAHEVVHDPGTFLLPPGFFLLCHDAKSVDPAKVQKNMETGKRPWPCVRNIVKGRTYHIVRFKPITIKTKTYELRLHSREHRQTDC